MPSVRLKENEPFDVALRRFKRTIEKTGLLTELRAREFYEKPTAERKRKKAAAVKRHYKRLRSQMLPKKKYEKKYWGSVPAGGPRRWTRPTRRLASAKPLKAGRKPTGCRQRLSTAVADNKAPTQGADTRRRHQDRPAHGGLVRS